MTLLAGENGYMQILDFILDSLGGRNHFDLVFLEIPHGVFETV